MMRRGEQHQHWRQHQCCCYVLAIACLAWHAHGKCDIKLYGHMVDCLNLVGEPVSCQDYTYFGSCIPQDCCNGAKRIGHISRNWARLPKGCEASLCGGPFDHRSITIDKLLRSSLKVTAAPATTTAAPLEEASEGKGTTMLTSNSTSASLASTPVPRRALVSMVVAATTVIVGVH